MAIGEDFPMIPEIETGMPPNTDPVSVAFGLYPRLNKDASAKAGYEVFEDVEFIKIRVPADRFFEYFQPATDSHRKRFPKAYHSFKERTQGRLGIVGMPIENWPSVNRSQAMTLKGAGLHTVEELAAVSDSNVDRLGLNGRTLRDTARVFLQTAKDSAETNRIAKERDELQAQLKAMQAQIDGMKAHGATGNVKPSGVIADDVSDDVVAAARRPRPGSKAA